MAKTTRPKITESGCLNSEQRKIVQWLKKVRFHKRLFGGVDERDVWKKIGELNEMYNAALAAERVRYETLLEERTKEADRARLDTDLTGGERG